MPNLLIYLKRALSFCLRNWLLLPIALVMLVNLKLYTGPDLSDHSSVQSDVMAQMDYLSPQIHDQSLGQRMQRLFPEGHLFTHVLYGLTWCELALQADADVATRELALQEARFAFAQIDSKEGQATFETGMDPAFGMFYQGWRNYLLAKIVQASRGNNPAELQHFEVLSAVVDACFARSLTPFPDSYPDQSWPADACVGMASLALHDRLVAPRFSDRITNWVEQIKHGSQEKLLPHQANSLPSGTNYDQTGTARGCSGVLNLYFLPDIDADLAAAQFEQFHTQFWQTRMGLATVREYPAGNSGEGDVDSGPLIWGVGFSATIVGIGAYLRMGDVEHAQAISDAVEALGFSHSFGGKHYIGGLLPVADLFIAWARMQSSDAQVMRRQPTFHAQVASKLRFHAYSIAILAFILCLYFRQKIKRLFRRTETKTEVARPDQS